MTCDLTEFAFLPMDELTAGIERMIANHHAPRNNYNERINSTTKQNEEVNHGNI